MNHVIRHFHWTAKRNWGDLLGPILLRYFSQIETILSSPENADMVSVGSIIDLLPSTYSGYILGSGKLRGSHIKVPNSAKILALRGPLSAQGIHKDIALGDPALLADEMVGPVDKLYNLCLVAHWSDRNLYKRAELLKYNPVLINPLDDPINIIKTIGQSRKVVTSSLHGMIVADAFGIPRRFEMTPQLGKEGGLFKFLDYNLAVGVRNFEPGKLIEPSRFRVNDRKHELYDVYRDASRLKI